MYIDLSRTAPDRLIASIDAMVTSKSPPTEIRLGPAGFEVLLEAGLVEFRYHKAYLINTKLVMQLVP